MVGVWSGKIEGLPAVTLTVEQESGTVMGAALFYLIRRNPGGAPSASPGVPEPMFDISFDGATLYFKISHRHAHPPRTLHDPPVSFRLVLTGPNRAKLRAPEPPVSGNDQRQIASVLLPGYAACELAHTLAPEVRPKEGGTLAHFIHPI